MVRLLTLAVLGGFAAFLATSTVEANDGAAAPAAAAVTSAPAATATPAPAAAPVRVAAPRRTYRSYSYAPTTSSRLRGYRSRAYAYGVRDAASKSLGVNQPFNR